MQKKTYPLPFSGEGEHYKILHENAKLKYFPVIHSPQAAEG